MEKQGRLFWVGLAAVLTVGAADYAWAVGPSDSASASARAKVIKPVRITAQEDMDFGEVLTSASSGTVVLGTDGSVNATGGAYVFDDTAAQAAEFRVSGERNEAYNVTLPTSVTLSELGGDTMTVSSFTHNATEVLSTSGQEDFAVGATLGVGADQLEGDYSGSFTVSVDYP